MAKENIVTLTKKYIIVGTLDAENLMIENPSTGTISLAEILSLLDENEIKITIERTLENIIEPIEE